MSEPRTVMDDAVRLLNSDPLLRAARDITVAATRGAFEGDPKVAAAATLIVASRTPTPTILLPKLRALSALVARYDAATTALKYAVSLTDVGEHTRARDVAWGEIVAMWRGL